MRSTSHAVYCVASQLCRLGHVRSGEYIAAEHHCDIDTHKPSYACVSPKGEVVHAEESYDETYGFSRSLYPFMRTVLDPDWSAFGAAKAMVLCVGVKAALVAAGEEVAA